MFKNIVVSIDGSQPSSHALAVGVDVAKQYGARLTIVHAVMDDASLAELMEVAKSHGFIDLIIADLDEATSVTRIPVPISAAPLVAIPEELLEKIGKLLLEETASQARALGLEKAETALLGEDAAREVLHFAETNDVDLIVCGTRGLGGIKSFFLGSVSHKLLEEAKCPCLVVKQGRMSRKHHSDHFGALADLQIGGVIGNRIRPVRVWGPSGHKSEFGIAYAMEHMEKVFTWDSGSQLS